MPIKFINLASEEALADTVCPFSRDTGSRHCLGDKCMAWQTVLTRHEQEMTDGNASKQRLYGSGLLTDGRISTLHYERRGAYEWAIVPAMGYCGRLPNVEGK